MSDRVRQSAAFWIDRARGLENTLLGPQEIQAFNRNAMAVDPFLVDLASYPERLRREDVERLILSMSKPPEDPYHYHDGRAIEPSDYDRYRRNLALSELPGQVEVRYALVLERADMRTWPTTDRAFKSNGDPRLDRFQENGLFPAEAVVVLHQSADDLWCFAQSYNYAAWVPAERLVSGERKTVLRYRKSPDFLVVTGSRASAERGASRDPVNLEMGVRLPQMNGESPFHGENRPRLTTHHAIRLPVRNGDGSLAFDSAFIERNDNVQKGYLPYSRANVLRQAFKFLGEHYGWGHSENARDCTGLVSEIYKTMGVLLPRNSWQQGQSPVGRNLRFEPEMPEPEKIRAVLASEPGDLLYSRGHVMIYLGSLEGEPYVIHDTAGAGRVDDDGTYHEGEFTGVSVSPLVSLHNSRDTSYLDEMYAIKQIT